MPRAAEAGAAALAKRAPIDDAYSICENLFSEVQTYTAAISKEHGKHRKSAIPRANKTTDATATSVSSSSSQPDKDAAASSVGTQLSSITSAVQSAKSQVDALSGASSKSKLMARQGVTPDQLALLVEQIILEISGALNNIIADLGLGT